MSRKPDKRNRTLITKTPSALVKCIFPTSILSAMLCFLPLFWSISTKTSILIANLSLGAVLAIFGFAITFGVYFNNQFVGYIYFGSPGRPSSIVYKGSIQYSIGTSVALIIGLGIFSLGGAFILSEIAFNHHILRES